MSDGLRDNGVEPRSTRLIERIVALVIGASFGVLLAWFVVEWPSPPPLILRVAGWVFFVANGTAFIYCVEEAR